MATATTQVATADTVKLSANLVRLVNRHAVVKEMERFTRIEKKAIERKLRTYLEDHDARRGTGGRNQTLVELVADGRVDIDVKLLREERPDVAKEYERKLSWTELNFPQEHKSRSKKAAVAS